jgi:hypothetical protein
LQPTLSDDANLGQLEETMRLVIALLMTLGLFAFAALSMPAVVAGGGYVVAAQEQPQQPPPQQQPQQQPQQPPQQPQQQSQQPSSGEVNVDINTHRSGGDWWANPVWIGGGVIALIVLIAIVAMASRGGTTIVKS